MVRLGDINPQVWDEVTSYMEKKLKKYEFSAEDLQFDFRVMAGARKRDRLLNEQFGMFKGIILHPVTQYIKQVVENNFSTDILLGDPLIPLATAVILLYMMYRRVPHDAVILIACFIFNVNPIYVVILFILWKSHSVKHKPKDFVRVTPKRPVEKFSPLEALTDKPFDFILLGNNISTLYTAALLSKAGQRCCVVISENTPSVEVFPEAAPCPVIIESLRIGKVDRYQSLLDAAQDMQQRVTFAPIGEPEDGYTHTIINRVRKSRSPQSLPNTFALRSGKSSFVSDIGAKCSFDRSKVLEFSQALSGALTLVTEYLIAKVSPIGEEPKKKDAIKNFMDLCTATCDQLLGSLADAYDLCESLAAVAVSGAGSSLPSNRCSALNLASALSSGEFGVFHPVGEERRREREDLFVGECSIMRSLSRTVLSYGGDLCRGSVKGFVGEDNHVKGIEIVGETGETNGKVIESAQCAGNKYLELLAAKGVVSGLGLIYTHTKLMPGQPLSEKTGAALSRVQEARPKIRVIFWVEGSSDSLGLSTSEYFEVAAQPRDGDLNGYVGSYIRVWSPSARDPNHAKRHGEIQTLVVEFEADDTLVNLKSIPVTVNGEVIAGPQIYDSTSRQDDDESLKHMLYMSRGTSDHFLLVAEAKVQSLYPKVSGKVIFKYLMKPLLGGFQVASYSSKYLAHLNAIADVKGLTFCGPDIGTGGLAGDIQSGWIAANSALGYSSQDLRMNRNIVNDLKNV